MTKKPLLDRLDRWLWRGSQGVGDLAIVVVLGLVSMQVLNRYVRSNPFVWTEELARAGLVWMTFMGTAALAGQGRHIAIDAFTSRLDHKTQKRLEVLANVIVLVATATFLPALVQRMIRISSMEASASGLSMFVFVGPSVIGFSLIGLHSLLHLVGFVSPRNAMSSDGGDHPDPEMGT